MSCSHGLVRDIQRCSTKRKLRLVVGTLDRKRIIELQSPTVAVRNGNRNLDRSAVPLFQLLHGSQRIV